MAKDRSEELQDHHNQGEKDAVEYNGHNPPASGLPNFGHWMASGFYPFMMGVHPSTL
jgi:hypothetical protein